MSELGIGTAIAEAVLARIRELESKKEELVAAWMAQHGFHPDECQLVVQYLDEANGFAQRIWVEKRGELEELRQLRKRVANVEKALNDLHYRVRDPIAEGFGLPAEFDPVPTFANEHVVEAMDLCIETVTKALEET